MKYLILFFISFQLFAIDHFTKCDNGLIVSGPNARQVCGADCFPILEFPFSCDFGKVIDEHNTKTKMVSCIDEQDCTNKFLELRCDQKEKAIKNLDLMQVYCSEFIEKHYGIDAEKKQLHDEKVAKDLADQLASDLAQKNIETGTALKSFILSKKVGKGFNTAKSKQFNLIFVDIFDMLETGDLENAKIEISALIPIDFILTVSDISEIITEANKP